jgi:hypothetical protein
MASQNTGSAGPIIQHPDTDIGEAKIAESASAAASSANDYNERTDVEESVPNISEIAEKTQPRVVTWASDHDQENPRNWPKWKKWYISKEEADAGM